MSRICPEMDDHEWVIDKQRGTFCQSCNLNLEDALEAHTMAELDKEEEDNE